MDARMPSILFIDKKAGFIIGTIRKAKTLTSQIRYSFNTFFTIVMLRPPLQFFQSVCIQRHEENYTFHDRLYYRINIH